MRMCGETDFVCVEDPWADSHPDPVSPAEGESMTGICLSSILSRTDVGDASVVMAVDASAGGPPEKSSEDKSGLAF